MSQTLANRPTLPKATLLALAILGFLLDTLPSFLNLEEGSGVQVHSHPWDREEDTSSDDFADGPSLAIACSQTHLPSSPFLMALSTAGPVHLGSFPIVRLRNSTPTARDARPHALRC